MLAGQHAPTPVGLLWIMRLTLQYKVGSAMVGINVILKSLHKYRSEVSI